MHALRAAANSFQQFGAVLLELTLKSGRVGFKSLLDCVDENDLFGRIRDGPKVLEALDKVQGEGVVFF